MDELPETFVPGFHCEESVRKLRYNPFVGGRKVSCVSLGGAAIAGIYDSAIDKELSYNVIRDAIRRGINLIDVAPWYGHGVGETELGHALKGVPRNAYYLTTKVSPIIHSTYHFPVLLWLYLMQVGRYEADRIKQFDFSREKTISSVYESLKRLKVEYIDGIQVHDPEFCPNLEIIVKETLPALLELKRKGLVRWMGITGYPIQVLKDLSQHYRELEIESCLSYARNNLHDTSLISSGLLEEFHEKGIFLVNGSPLSMGLLTTRRAPEWHPASAALREIVDKAILFSQANGVSFERIALYYALCLTGAGDMEFREKLPPNTSGVATTMFSTVHQNQLDEALELASKDFKLQDSERRTLRALLQHPFFCELPENVCAWENIEVQKYFAAVGRTLLCEWYKSRSKDSVQNEVLANEQRPTPVDNSTNMIAVAVNALNKANV